MSGGRKGLGSARREREAFAFMEGDYEDTGLERRWWRCRIGL